MADTLLRRLQEKRRAPRFLGLFRIEYASFRNLVEVHSTAFIRNISVLGLSIPLNKSIRTGQRLLLKINPPYEDKPVYTFGKVVWKDNSQQNSRGEAFGGIKFLDINRQDSSKILNYSLKPQLLPA